MKTALRIIWLSVIGLFFAGCAIFDPAEKSSGGYFQDHYYSCGPIALQRAFFRLDLLSDEILISKEIQDRGNFCREILSCFNKEAASITWPKEIRYICKKYGFKIINVNNIKTLDHNKDVAIILIQKSGTLIYHWACFPINENIENFFYDKTKIVRIYLLKKT